MKHTINCHLTLNESAVLEVGYLEKASSFCSEIEENNNENINIFCLEIEENNNENINIFLNREQAHKIFTGLESELFDESYEALETRALAAERRVEELEEAIACIQEARRDGY